MACAYFFWKITHDAHMQFEQPCLFIHTLLCQHIPRKDCSTYLNCTCSARCGNAETRSLGDTISVGFFALSPTPGTTHLGSGHPLMSFPTDPSFSHMLE